MKRRTKKEIAHRYDRIMVAPYGKLQTLFKSVGLQPAFYISGRYGWKASIYEIDHRTAISIGYEPSISKEKDIPFDGYLEILFEGRALKGAREGKSREYFEELYQMFLEELDLEIREYYNYKGYEDIA